MSVTIVGEPLIGIICYNYRLSSTFKPPCLNVLKINYALFLLDFPVSCMNLTVSQCGAYYSKEIRNVIMKW